MCLNQVVCPAEVGEVKWLVLFDSDFAGCLCTRRSTTGVLGVLCGQRTWAPMLFISKRQGATGLSTPETETVAGCVAYKRGSRVLLLIEALLRRKVEEVYLGDNTASERVLAAGSANLAYMRRNQGVSLAALKETIGRVIGRVPKNKNTSDTFTKALEVQEFEKFRTQLGVW